jgi:thiamine-monophosphate kinase
MKKLSEIGEDELIRRLVAGFGTTRQLTVGPGDDCAIWDEGRESLLLLKTDALVEGIHFLPEADPSAVGWKAIARVASDIAAMAGEPEAYLVTVALRPDMPVSWVERLYAGMRRAMDLCGGVLAGGETTAVPQGSAVVITVAATGTVGREIAVLRSTGRAGDVVAVTGELGGSLAGKHLNFLPRLAQGKWLAQRGATAMMDLSDGLGRDLPRLAAASGCGWALDEATLPRTPGSSVAAALNDGEDYELLVTLPADGLGELLLAWAEQFPTLPLTPVGRLTGQPATPQGATGWEHFRHSPPS